VWGRWLRARSGPGDAWHEYWRKPFRKRLTRWGGRLLRPLRDRAIERRGLRAVLAPPMSAAYWCTPLEPVAELARRLGGSVNDLVAALALRAALRGEGSAGEASLALPVSRRRREGAGVRNSIVMLRVTVPAGTGLAAAVAAVHEQVTGFARSGEGDLRGAESRGYASYLPYRRERAAIGGAEVRRVLMWPVPAPGARFGLLASSYAGELSFTARAAPGLSAEDLLAAVRAELAAEGVAAAGPAAPVEEVVVS
jgi:hypothetical protein